MSVGIKEGLKNNFDKNLQKLFEKIQTSEHKSSLPYGRPMNLIPVTSSVEIMPVSKWKALQKDLIPNLHKNIVKKYAFLKADTKIIEVHLKKIEKLKEIKEYYIDKRKKFLSENFLEQQMKTFKDKELKQQIQNVKKSINKIEVIVNEKLDEARKKISTLDVIKKDFQMQMKNDKVSRVSKNFIDIRDGIMLCDSIVSKANKKLDSFSKRIEKQIDVPKMSKQIFKDKEIVIGTWVK